MKNYDGNERNINSNLNMIIIKYNLIYDIIYRLFKLIKLFQRSIRFIRFFYF